MTVTESWLRRRRNVEILLSLLTALLAAVAGVVTLFLTFWLTYAVIFIGTRGVSAVAELAFNQRLHLSHDGRLWISGGFLVLLFIGNATTSREETETYPHCDYRPSNGAPMLLGAAGSLVWMLAYPEASSKMISSLLLTGPRLLGGAWRAVGQALQLIQLDVSACAVVIRLMVARGGRLDYEEITALALHDRLRGLNRIEGVVFMESGLSLTDELRAVLLDLGAREGREASGHTIA